jgi:hypothetical protein
MLSLHMQLEIFFTDGIRKLMNPSNKCVAKLKDNSKKYSAGVHAHLLYSRKN